MKTANAHRDKAARRHWAALIVSAAAVPAMYLAARTTAVELQPSSAAAISPTDRSPLLKPILLIAADPRRQVTPEMVSLAEEAARSAPHSWEPFVIKAAEAEQRGRLIEAVQLLEEARRRRPGATIVRLKLMFLYGKLRREPELVRELDYILRSSGEARQLVLPELAKMLRRADGRAALAEILSGNPAWREEFLEYAKRIDIRPSEAEDLLRRAAGHGRADLALERTLYLQALTAAGEYRRAREQWRLMLPAAGRERHSLMFNPGFEPLHATPPFGWELLDNEVGRTEVIATTDGKGDLSVQYFGGRIGYLAQQLVALTPGAYNFSMRAKSDGEARTGRLLWRISCVPSEASLASIQMNKLKPGYERRDVSFRVPQVGCDGQRIRLIGEPGDVSSTISAQVSDVELTRED